MKTELKLAEHSTIPRAQVVEIWWNGRMVGQITGADGPGVRVISKYPVNYERVANPRVAPVNILEVKIGG